MTHAPPWIQTITGRRPPSPAAGVHTLSVRQSSLCVRNDHPQEAGQRTARLIRPGPEA